MYVFERMKMNRKNMIGMIALLMTITMGIGKLSAAAITMADLPYLCDFENDEENANWVLNPSINTITTNNAWVIGSTIAYTGRKSLYVSQDGGATNTYAQTNNVLLAYRDITLEAGDYDVAYDWIGTGNKTRGYVKVIYANRPTSGLNCLGNATEPTYVSSAVQLMGDNESLVDGDSWRHIQARITIPVAQANKTTTRLLFIWVNNDATIRDSITSITIDNFQLAKASPNDYPSNIHVTTVLNNSTVSWDGSAEEYEVMYRKKTDSGFTTVPVDGNSVTLENVEYGAYEFWICGVNGEDKTVYTVFPVVYLYETDCFDALNMYNATFEYGSWQYRTGKDVKGTTRVDYGPGDVRSRHTTHFDLTEVDPRTVVMNGRDTVACLRTVPTGEFGSVRLGNWNTGSEYESMTFHYTVESNSMAVLLIKYAIVLENPDHQETEQPRFTLDVFDESGVSIDTKCASVDFHSPTPREWQNPEIQALWHTNNWSTGPSGSRTVMWQDWKTIGISMEDYIGKTLTITLTSYDCDQGGHFGYAYFMLNCSRSDVDGLPWGEGSTTQQFTAPNGFDYAWFNRNDEQLADTLSQERFFYVLESDTNTYLCHATYPSNPECGFWFDASAKPHHPKAELAWKWAPRNCQNGFIWYNKCHVLLVNQQTGEVEHRYDKQLESCFLIYDDQTEAAIGYEENGNYVAMPDDGGTVYYGVRTGVYVNNQLFADTAWYEIEIPAIGPVDTHLYDTVCRGESIIFPIGTHNKRAETGDYADSLISVITGCDSTVIMHLKVHEPKMEEVYDTICPGGRYSFNGKVLTTTGKQTAMVTSMETGCDSLVTLWLTVAPRPTIEVANPRLCADQPLLLVSPERPFMDRMRVEVDEIDTLFQLRGNDDEISVQIGNRQAGPQTAIVYTYMPWCDTYFVDSVEFEVSLSSSIIEARFDDVLTFLSEAYNGGLTFTSYQWYANGVAIEGATQSWYYEPGLDPDTEYTVRVTLADGTQVWVCPFSFNERHQTLGVDETETREFPRKLLRDGQLIIQCNHHEYDARGARIR